MSYLTNHDTQTSNAHPAAYAAVIGRQPQIHHFDILDKRSNTPLAHRATANNSYLYQPPKISLAYLVIFLFLCLSWLCVDPIRGAPAAGTGSTGAGSPAGKNLALGQKRIKDCCQLTGMSSDCMSICKYEANLTELICKAEKCHSEMNRWMYCASDAKDNTDCCKGRNVPEICWPFCQGTSLPSKELFGANFLQCTDPKVMNIVFQCHLNGLQATERWISDYESKRPTLRSSEPLPADKQVLLQKLANESCQKNPSTMVRQMRELKTDHKINVV